MATTTVTAQDLVQLPTLTERALRRPARSLWSDAWRQFQRHHLAMAGVVVFALLLLATLIAPLLWRTSGEAIDYAAGLLGPSLQHPFGTDDLGRDLFARALLGGRVSIAVGVVAVLIGVSVGTLVGAIAGFFVRMDTPLMRVTDLFLS